MNSPGDRKQSLNPIIPLGPLSDSEGRGGPPNLWKTNFGMFDPNSFLNNQLYIYKKDLDIKGTVHSFKSVFLG